MEDIAKRQEDIRRRAEHLMRRNDEIISIVDNWMPAEEANANMEREFMERRRRERESVAATAAPACPPKHSLWTRFLFGVRRRMIGEA